MKIKSALKYIHNFGIYNTCKWKILKKVNVKKYHKSIYQYLEKFYIENFKETTKKKNTKKIDTYNIWIFWAQGEENMPSVVRACYKSIIAHANDCKVNLLDKNNYRQYVEIENGIKEKLDSGIISLTHFSDILRVKLLNKYGGLWLDATVFLTKDIDKTFMDRELFSIRIDYDETYISRGIWSVFLMGTDKKEQEAFKLVEALLKKYWEKHDFMIDYYLIDYFLLVAYNSLPNVKKEFDKNEKGDLYWLQANFSKPFITEEWNEKIKKNTFFKLSYKEKIEKTKNTYFDYIIHE